MFINRDVSDQIDEALDKKLILIIYGPRQIGKTTLAKRLLAKYDRSKYYTCDDPDVIKTFQGASLAKLNNILKNIDLVIIDEAQRIENIGLTAKLIHDNIPDTRLVLTGSSSLDLANKINEPLTGRSVDILVRPISLHELDHDPVNQQSIIERQLVYGGYPAIWTNNDADAKATIERISSQYLFKDTLAYQTIFDQALLNNLVLHLAHQLGQELNYNSLANKLKVSRDTIVRYVSLLEQSFVIYRVYQYRAKMNTEIGRLRKVFFYDLGIRNALVSNFEPTEYRSDIGALWENYCYNERRNHLQHNGIIYTHNYWRGRDGREVDMIEQQGTSLKAYEFKYYADKLTRIPGKFSAMYPEISYQQIDIDNIADFIL